jgi:hypothetical protein
MLTSNLADICFKFSRVFAVSPISSQTSHILNLTIHPLKVHTKNYLITRIRQARPRDLLWISLNSAPHMSGLIPNGDCAIY